MITIRIFRTIEEAGRAKDILKKGGFEVTIAEDKLNNVPIQEFGVPARFRLNVEDRDYYKVAKFLAGKIKKRDK